MKKLFFTLAVVSLFCGSVFAQEKGKIRGGFDLGYAIPTGGGGVSLGAEVKYNLQDNMNVGLRWTTAFMAKQVGDSDASLSGNSGYVATFDYYYLAKGTSKFSPFVGAGVGMFSLASLSVDIAGSDVSLGESSSEFGAVIRTGFELGKFRLAAEYTMLPSSDLKNTIGSTTTSISVKNSYFGINFGVYFGGGKWKK